MNIRMFVKLSLENMDMSEFQNDATCGQTKKRVLQLSGMKIPFLYIARLNKNMLLLNVRTIISRSPTILGGRNARPNRECH